MKSHLSKKVIKTIVALIKEDTYTVAEMCKKAHISERSYYTWKKENAEFAEAIKTAEEEAIDMRLAECRTSLVKLINGFEYDEVKETFEDGVSTEKTVTKKRVTPNLGAIIHYQTNMDPSTWKNKQHVEAEVSISQFNEMMKKVSERKKK